MLGMIRSTSAGSTSWTGPSAYSPFARPTPGICPLLKMAKATLGFDRRLMEWRASTLETQ